MSILFLVLGFGLASVGVCLCMTGIGAIIGVPCALLGGALFGLGFRNLVDRRRRAPEGDVEWADEG